MSNLFYLPRVHSQPGAKIYFRQTGTSTPQNTYTDADLSVAHSNPVVADAEGYFDPIYLDPSLPNYRVIHTDGSNVDNDPTMETELEPTLDDVPSGQKQSRSYRLKSTAPDLIFEETDQADGNKKWRVQANGNQLTIAPLDAAESAISGGIAILRDGTVVADTIDVATQVSVDGLPTVTTETDVYTGALTGCTAGLSVPVTYTRIGLIVVLRWGQQSGTSNATTMTITGMPAAIRPSAARAGNTVVIVENGTVQEGRVVIETNGTLTFSVGLDGAAFTASGSKGVREAIITYGLSGS